MPGWVGFVIGLVAAVDSLGGTAANWFYDLPDTSSTTISVQSAACS